MDYQIIYSGRKTLAVCVKNAEVIVRAPKGLNKSVIEAFVRKHDKWIRKKVEYQKSVSNKRTAPQNDDVELLKKSAKIYFDDKTRYFAKIMNIDYGRIKITSAQKRFGSCNSKGNICYTYRLMLYPESAREYVVVHELAHIIHMNHSRDFYKLVEKYLPDYKERRRLLL